MIENNRFLGCRFARTRRKGAALYIAVLSTALIVSLLGLAGLTVVRIERRQAAGATDLLVARANAQSSVELALVQLSNSTDWRTTWAHGVESAPLTLGPNGRGTLSWILEDSDGSLAYPDAMLRLKGVGRVGNTVQVAGVEVVIAEVAAELRSRTDDSLSEGDSLTASQWWCQYFKPNLPADAIAWKITSVELMCVKGTKDETFAVVLYEPNALKMPGSTVLESLDLFSNDLPNKSSWVGFTFLGEHVRQADQGICIGLTTTDTLPVKLKYQISGVAEPDTGLVRGYPNWSSFEPDKALLYRTHGVYWSEYGDAGAKEGTWLWEAAP